MKRMTALIFAAALLLLSGCSNAGTVYSNYRELEDMELILTMGFDSAGDRLRMSVAGGSTKSGGKGSPAPATRMVTDGSTITEAMEALQDYAVKEELFYSHTQYVLVGEACAEKELGRILEHLETDHGVRASVPLFIIREDTAEHLVLNCGGEKSDITEVLHSIIRDSKRRGDGHPFSCGEIVSELEEYGAALAMALKTEPTQQAQPDAKEDMISPLPDGYAILKDNTIVGYISGEDAQGVNLLIEQPGIGSITVWDRSCGYLSLVLTKCKIDLRPVWGQDGSVSGIRAEIDASAYLKEAELPEQMDQASVLKALERQLEKRVKNVLQKMSDTEADFLGIGRKLRMQSPGKWDSAPKSWEQVIGDLTIQTQARCMMTQNSELRREHDARPSDN